MGKIYEVAETKEEVRRVMVSKRDLRSRLAYFQRVE